MRSFILLNKCSKIFFAACLFGAFSMHAHASQTVTLEDTLNFAFAYSPNVKAAQEVRQQAVHDVRVAEAGYYPTIGIWGGFGVQQANDISTRSTDEEFTVVGAGNAGVQLSQTIWQGGYTSSRVRVQNELLAQRGWLVMDSANSLAYAAISAHADVLRRRELVRLAKDNVKEIERILSTLRTRSSQGLSSQGDLDLVRGRLSRANASLSQHTQGLATAHAIYMQVTGQPVAQNLGPVVHPKRIYANEDEARNIAVSKNHQIQADLAAIRSAVADKDVVRSNFAPRISVDAGSQYNDNFYEDNTSSLSWNAMLNMRWDIFSGGRDVAQLKSKAARARELRHALHATMDTINQELVTTSSFTKNAADQAKYYEMASQSSKKAKRNYNTQFNVGQKDLLSVLDAEGEYFFSIVEYNVLKVDAVLGNYRMLALAGELLEEVNMTGSALLTSKGGAPADGPVWSFAPEQVNTQEMTQGTTLTTP